MTLTYNVLYVANERKRKMSRILFDMDREWKFHLGDITEQEINSHATSYTRCKAGAVVGPGGKHWNDREWRTVDLPHDYFSESDMRAENLISHGYRTRDNAWYRKSFILDPSLEGKQLLICFEGTAVNAEFYFNGSLMARSFSAYTETVFDISERAYFDGRTNILAVHINGFETEGWWYEGAGIYRHVRLYAKDSLHIAHNGIFGKPVLKKGSKNSWNVEIETMLENSAYSPASATVRATILDGETVVAEGTSAEALCDYASKIAVKQKLSVSRPKRWDVDSPNLYTLKIEVIRDGEVIDTESTRIGFRTFRVDAEKGFFLNDRPLKMNGVCNHHDLGSLGAAVNAAALRRQLGLMKEMGVNAIRTSHNPPSPELLDLCDEMGLMVMDEFFDEWYIPKISNGYAKYYREHAKQDVTDVVRRDRNHPSVVLWSIGNEMYEQTDKEGWRAAKMLTDAAHAADPTRPVTAGFCVFWSCFDNHLVNFVDVVGFNYQPHRYEQIHREHPDMILLGTETASCVSTRGVYHLPAEVSIPVPEAEDLTVSAYELSAPVWAYYPEREFAAQDDMPYMVGEFVWTGMDYLGEPTPYYNKWPSRSSYFGIVDLAGLPKNRFYGYQAHWTNKEVLHVFPHWNWEGREGERIPVHVYTNYPTVELFVNGVSLGRKHPAQSGSVSADKDGREIPRYRLVWEDVVYQPGEVKAVGFDENGNKRKETVIRTAGAPHHLVLTADRPRIAADGDDLVYITAAVVDAQGVVCPHADHRITFTTRGAGELLTTDSGDQRETESFARPDKKALTGYTVACIRSLRDVCGSLTVAAAAEGLAPGSVTVEVER
jgi:beta-galactosidase